MAGDNISVPLELFGVTPKIRTIAVVGAGGKTSLMYFLAREFVVQGRTVVTTTTTKIMPPDASQSPCLLTLDDDPKLVSLPSRLSMGCHVTLGSKIVASTGKLAGIDEMTIDACLKAAQHVVIESDGAKGRSIKAPAAWEPVIPKQTDLVIAVVGLDCLGKKASEEWVFRLERFSAITRLQRDHVITPHAVAILLNHPQGGLKEVRSNTRFVAFLNKKDLVQDDRWIGETARAAFKFGGEKIFQVVSGSLLKDHVILEAFLKGIRDAAPVASYHS